jgi:hypothetical protein
LLFHFLLFFLAAFASLCSIASYSVFASLQSGEWAAVRIQNNASRRSEEAGNKKSRAEPDGSSARPNVP